MAETETDMPRPFDVLAALGLLTRLPVRVDPARAEARGGRAAWAWPLAGLLVGLASGLAGGLALWLGLGPGIAALIVLGAGAALTGAMHEDGLADSMDGLWGGWTRERRLAIMKDSQIGAFGVVVLIVTFGLRWQALAALAALLPLWAVAAGIGLLSRVPMVALMTLLPHARETGLSARVGAPPPFTAGLAALVGLGLALPFLGLAVIPVALVIGIAATIWAMIARARIGGQTGDILGAAQQWAEVAGLLGLLAFVA